MSKFNFKIVEDSLGHELRAVCFGAAFDARRAIRYAMKQLLMHRRNIGENLNF